MTDSKRIVCTSCQAINQMPASRVVDKPRCGKCKSPLFTGLPVDLGTSNFERFITRNDIPVLIDFWAPWCGPCKTMAPILAQSVSSLEPGVRVAKLNTEAEQTLADRYQIRSIPTLALFYQGKEIARQAGAMDQGSLLRWVNQVTSQL